MRAGACLLFVAGALALVVGALLGKTTALPLAATAACLAGLCTLLILRRAGPGVLTFGLALFVGLSACETLLGGPPHLASAATVLALLGWDTTLTAVGIAPFPAADRRRLTRRHALKVLALGGGSVALTTGALESHIQLGFSAMLAAGLASLALLAVAFRSVLGPREKASGVGRRRSLISPFFRLRPGKREAGGR